MPNGPLVSTKANALIIAASTGILLGAGGCAPRANGAKSPDARGASVVVPSFAPASSDAPMPGAKDCCRAKNACKGQSGCLTETNPRGAGKNECRTKGTSCPKPA